MKRTLNFGHRGFKSQYPENTMLAFKKAVEIGVDGLEFDVQLSKDGIPVIIHDETIDRTCKKHSFVKDLNFGELRKLNAGAYFNLNFDEKIPSLEEYFEYIKTKDIISNIELKTGIFEYTGIEEIVYALIKKYDADEKCIISSFNHESVLRFKKIAPHIKCGFLVDSWEIDPCPILKKFSIECYHPSAYRLTKNFVNMLHNQNIEINAWFGSIQTDYRKVLETGLDIIITDYPDKIAGIQKKSSALDKT